MDETMYKFWLVIFALVLWMCALDGRAEPHCGALASSVVYKVEQRGFRLSHYIIANKKAIGWWWVKGGDRFGVLVVEQSEVQKFIRLLIKHKYKVRDHGNCYFQLLENPRIISINNFIKDADI